MEMEELKERDKELNHQGKPTWRWEPEDGGREHGLKEVEHRHEGEDQDDEGGEQEDRGREVGREEVEKGMKVEIDTKKEETRIQILRGRWNMKIGCPSFWQIPIGKS